MSTQEVLLEKINRQREEEAWADLRPTREAEQEVLDLLDGHEPAPR